VIVAGKKKYFTVKDIKKAGYSLEPIKCKHCGSTEVTYNQGIGDGYCADCGKWQSEKKRTRKKKE
jgi:hypothetical protein